MTELLIGCGRKRERKFVLAGKKDWDDLVTLDYEPSHNPDVVHDLEVLPLPFEDNSFDEIHAYECLEHVGKQGDWKFFLNQWSDFWRILKPAGLFAATCPKATSFWAWGDPGHTRIVSPQSLMFLSQKEYSQQVGVTGMTDYRPFYKADFDFVYLEESDEHSIRFVLRAIKPSRFSENYNQER